MRQSQIDEHGQLNDGDQDEGQGQALFHQGNDQEDGRDGNGVDHLEIMAGGIDHVLHAGGFADEHALRIIALQNGVQILHLTAHRVAGDLIFGVDEHQLPVVALQNGADGIRQDLLRDQRPHDAFQPKDIFHALHLLHFRQHLLRAPPGQLGADQQHMGGGDIKLLRELAVGDDIFHVLRQTLAHIVIDLVVGLCIAGIGRPDQQGEEHQKQRECLAYCLGKAAHIRDQGPMAGPLQGLIQQQDQRGQQGHTANNTQHHALCHHQAQIPAQGEGHEAQGDKARHGGDGAAQDGGKGPADGLGHGLLMIIRMGQLLVVAVPQEDGVIHGDGQLQHRGQRLGDIGDLAEKPVAAQIQQDGNTDAGQKHKGHQPAIQQHHHGSTGAGYGQRHIDGLLLLTQVLQVGDQRRHSGNKALSAADAPDLPNGVHGHIRRGGRVKKDGHHSGIFRVEGIVKLFRQHFHRDGEIRYRIVPEHCIHMLHLLKLFLQHRHIPQGHILHDNQREGPLAKVVHQGVLPYDRIHILRQIIQHIIVNPCVLHPDGRRNQQQYAKHKDQNPMFYDGVCHMHCDQSFPISRYSTSMASVTSGFWCGTIFTVQIATQRFSAPSRNSDSPSRAVKSLVPASGRKIITAPTAPVSTAVSRISSQLRMPKRRESMAIWILNRPSASTGMPSRTQKKLMVPSGRARPTAPSARNRMPKARSY